MKDKREISTKRWLWLALFSISGAVVLICAFHFDSQVRNWIAHHQTRGTKIFMRNVSYLGDWPEHLALGLILIGLAYWRGSKKWVRVFAAMLLAFIIAGISARAIKIVGGRPRPSVKHESIWSGPHLSSRYNTFPSGHTAGSTAFFATLFFAGWRLGLACLPIPLLIGFSRLYVGAHYLSDVIGAALLGILCAFLAARLLLPQIENLKSEI